MQNEGAPQMDRRMLLSKLKGQSRLATWLVQSESSVVGLQKAISSLVQTSMAVNANSHILMLDFGCNILFVEKILKNKIKSVRISILGTQLWLGITDGVKTKRGSWILSRERKALQLLLLLFFKKKFTEIGCNPNSAFYV